MESRTKSTKIWQSTNIGIQTGYRGRELSEWERRGCQAGQVASKTGLPPLNHKTEAAIIERLTSEQKDQQIKEEGNFQLQWEDQCGENLRKKRNLYKIK